MIQVRGDVVVLNLCPTRSRKITDLRLIYVARRRVSELQIKSHNIVDGSFRFNKVWMISLFFFNNSNTGVMNKNGEKL